uniref:Uncharacterized protein n=1 Tax=Fundulus heteroclitus TaxID=8078 RepID=A0A146SR22_FUNHE
MLIFSKYFFIRAKSTFKYVLLLIIIIICFPKKSPINISHVFLNNSPRVFRTINHIQSLKCKLSMSVRNFFINQVHMMHTVNRASFCKVLYNLRIKCHHPACSSLSPQLGDGGAAIDHATYSLSLLHPCVRRPLLRQGEEPLELKPKRLPLQLNLIIYTVFFLFFAKSVQINCTRVR